MKNLKIPEFSDTKPLADNISHPTLKTIMKYRNRPSISAIKKTISGKTFQFSRLFEKILLGKLKKLSSKKAFHSTDIPLKIIRWNADILGSYLCELFNDCIKKYIFPANTTPNFKKGYEGSKENYRLLNILLVISKIFEKLLCKQITLFTEQLLSKDQCGFRKSFSAQDCLLAMLQKWKRIVDKGNVFGILLTDLSKTFECL